MSSNDNQFPIYERNLSEQIRDVYFDAITDVILASPYRGTIRFCLRSEFMYETSLEQRGKQVLHVDHITPQLLGMILGSFHNYNQINLYLE